MLSGVLSAVVEGETGKTTCESARLDDDCAGGGRTNWEDVATGEALSDVKVN